MNAMELYGVALKDYFGGIKTAEMAITRDDGHKTLLPLSVFFRGATELEIDRIALEHCRGRILDIGAGAGVHSLHLQERGYDVTAIDISPGACEVMRSRGVARVLCASIWNWNPKSKLDTLLILGRSIGLVENLEGFERFLDIARKVILPGGQVLLNSLDVRRTHDESNLEYQSRNIAKGKYCGEIKMRFEYAGQISVFADFLHLDSETLGQIAEKKRWYAALLYSDEDGNYLSNLTVKKR